MEELKNKTFLIKIRSELFDFLKTQNKHEKVGKLKIFLNKKRNKPEFIFHFNKDEEPKNFTLTFNKTEDFIYFGDKETNDTFKISNIDNFGNLIITEETKANELVKNIYAKEMEKNKDIKIRETKDGEKRYVQHEEIILDNNLYAGRDKKDKKTRIDENELIEYIKKEVTKNNLITPAQISDEYNIPEVQVKSVMEKICEKKPEGNRRYSYKLKEEYKDIY